MSMSVSCDGCYTSKDSEQGLSIMKITIDGKTVQTFHWCASCLIKKEHLSIWLKNPFYIKPKEEAKGVPYESPEGT